MEEFVSLSPEERIDLLKRLTFPEQCFQDREINK